MPIIFKKNECLFYTFRISKNSKSSWNALVKFILWYRNRRLIVDDFRYINLNKTLFLIWVLFSPSSYLLAARAQFSFKTCNTNKIPHNWFVWTFYWQNDDDDDRKWKNKICWSVEQCYRLEWTRPWVKMNIFMHRLICYSLTVYIYVKMNQFSSFFQFNKFQLRY